MKEYPTQEELSKILKYYEGNLYWTNKTGSRCNPSKLAGNTGARYKDIKINGSSYKQHRIIWILVNGAIGDGLVIDHIDGNGFNNHLDNLRLVSPKVNQHNQVNRKPRKLPTGVHKRNNRFATYMTIDGKYTYLGSFSSEKEAQQRYQQEQQAMIDELRAEIQALKGAL